METAEQAVEGLEVAAAAASGWRDELGMRRDAELPLHHPERIRADADAVLADARLVATPAFTLALHCLHLLSLHGDRRLREAMLWPWKERPSGRAAPSGDPSAGAPASRTRGSAWAAEEDELLRGCAAGADAAGCDLPGRSAAAKMQRWYKLRAAA